jgi:hypothetical protein
MKDRQSLALLESLHPAVRPKFQAFIEEIESAFGITIRIISAYRSMEEQQKIYNQGRTTPGPIVTKAVPGSSYHNWGLAVDIAPLTVSGKVDYNYDQSVWLAIGQKHGMTWGGSWTGFKDPDHWECKMGHNWRDLLDLYHLKKFVPGTEYVEI